MRKKIIICNYLINVSSYCSAIFIKTIGLMSEKCHGDFSLNLNLTYF